MDTNHGAGDPPDDEVFGPVEDGEEVFEWIDDQDSTDGPGEQAVKPPPPTFRERVAAVRSGGRRLRHARREIAAAAAALVLACAIGGACTAWFDNVAGAADRAEVVSLTINSVVDGDPAASSYNAHDTAATGQYIVEVANNSPDAVTLTSVSVDAGPLMMTSNAWKPVGGSARIPGGGTVKVALTVRLFCPSILLSQQTGMLDAGPGTGGGISLAFPAVHVRAVDSDGDLRDMILPTRVGTSAQLANSQLTFRGPSGAPIPEIISADAGACSEYATDRNSQRGTISIGADPFPSDVTFDYDKVLSPADHSSFVVGFTVQNTSTQTVTVSARGVTSYGDAPGLRTVWLPTTLTLAPGKSAPARLTVSIQDCTSILSSDPVLGGTMLEVDGDGAAPQPVFIDQALTGSLRLAGDIVHEEQAACS